MSLAVPLQVMPPITISTLIGKADQGFTSGGTNFPGLTVNLQAHVAHSGTYGIATNPAGTYNPVNKAGWHPT